MSLADRLKRIEKKQGGQYADVEELIRKQRFYDELTPREQMRYDEYKKSWGGCDSEKAACELENLFNDTPDAPLHFKLTPRTKPPTDAELEKRASEIQQLLFDDTKG